MDEESKLIEDVFNLDGDTNAKKASCEAHRVQYLKNCDMYEKLLSFPPFVEFANQMLARCGVMTNNERSDGRLPIKAGEENIGNWLINNILIYQPDRLIEVLSFRKKDDD